MGCSASTSNVGSLTLPTSNRVIDVTLHRTDSHECAVGWVLQTWNAEGQLIDAKAGSGNALHCQLLGAAIKAGGQVGAAALIAEGVRDAGSDTINNSNSNSNSQKQGQQQRQQQQQGQGQSSTNVNVNTNTVATGASTGASGGHGHGHGNNGRGNGGGDGSPNGHDDSDR
jgi:hypothetical protein